MKIGGDQLRVPGGIADISMRGSSIAVVSDPHGREGAVAIFDRTTGEARYRETVRPGQKPYAIAVSHAGDKIAVGLGGVRLLDASSFVELWNRPLSQNPRERHLAWTPDDAAIAHIATDGITLLDPRSGEVIKQLNKLTYATLLGHTTAGIAFRVAGTSKLHVLSASGEVTVLREILELPYSLVAGNVVIAQTMREGIEWRDLADGTVRGRLVVPTYWSVLGACARTQRIAVVDGRHVSDKPPAEANDPPSVDIVGPGGQRVSIPFPCMLTRAAAFDGDEVAISTGRGEVAVIDLVAHAVRVAAAPHASDPTSLAFVGDGHLACASETGAVLRDLSTGTILADLGRHEHVLAGGERILAYGARGAALFDRAGARLAELTTQNVSVAAISDDGTRVAIAPKGAAVTPRVFDGVAGALLFEHPGNGDVEWYSLRSMAPGHSVDPAKVYGLAFVSSDRLLVDFQNGTFVYFEGAERHEVQYVSSSNGIALGDGFLVAATEESLMVYPRDDGTIGERSTSDYKGRPRPFAVRGKLLAVGDIDGRVVLRDPITNVEVAADEAHGWEVAAVALDSSASRIASSGHDGTIVMRAVPGRQLHTEPQTTEKK